ncbi:MAG: hypothetical protein ABSH50_21725 [Bryobacteraceae bacterium]|jgi:hypothetical protein
MSARCENSYGSVVSREWVSDNWASAEHGMKASKVIEPKEPFSDRELEYIFKATELKTDGHGFKVKCTGQPNAWEILVFIWTLRYTGLRISDVVRLERRQLVPFSAYGYTHALWCHPTKTKEQREVNFIHIPIQASNLPGHPNVVRALQELSERQGRHFFWSGKGKLRTNITSRRSRANDVFTLAEVDGEGRMAYEEWHPFRRAPAPAQIPPYLCRHAATSRSAAPNCRAIPWRHRTDQKHYAKFCRAEQMEAAAVLAEP